MPYYISYYASPPYQNKKRIYALNRLYESGLFSGSLAVTVQVPDWLVLRAVGPETPLMTGGRLVPAGTHFPGS